MGSVVMSHLIGTVSLIVLFSIVGTYCTIYFSSLQPEVLADNLQGVSEYVSAEIVDIVSLCSLCTEDQLLVKKLEVPELIKGNAYNLSITRSESSLEVLAQVSLNPTIFGEALLPWSTEGNIKFFNGTDPGVNDSRIIPKVSVSSFSENLAVWCLKRSGRITFGLGLMEA